MKKKKNDILDSVAFPTMIIVVVFTWYNIQNNINLITNWILFTIAGLGLFVEWGRR